ncbi:winged helix-turn-helix transcriptional regulator [Actinoplanes sp. NPDC051343]|uniref:winged helix-turn-helix transcriptional regulator n=1 Tax=Actinoplanes sp. NPDC051343 TaxID=3363906 RepID=UPI00378BB502
MRHTQAATRTQEKYSRQLGVDQRFPDGFSFSLSRPGTRVENTRRILGVILQRGSVTARDLAQQTGLSVVTTNAILNKVVDSGLVEHVGLHRSNRGRQARVYSVPPKLVRAVIAVPSNDGLTMTWTDALDAAPVVIRNKQPNGLNADRLSDLILRTSGVHPPQYAVIGISPHAEAETASGRRILESNLTDLLACPVQVRTVAQLAAIAEGQLGAARGVRDFFFVTGPTMSICHVVNSVPRDGAQRLARLLELFESRLDLCSANGSAASPHDATASALAAACLVADPELIVLGEGLAHGCKAHLPDRIRTIFGGLRTVPPEVVTSTIPGDAALQGGLHVAKAGAIGRFLDIAAPTEVRSPT